MLREFANEVSLFCRRMTDLGYEKENYSCIIMRDVYERLNHDTVLRYRSKISLQRELGQNIEEDLDSLCTFLRSEATTLELSNFDSTSPISPKFPPSKKVYAMNREDDETNEDKDRDKCTLCRGENHRLIDCEKYMGMTPGKRREFIKTSRRCFSCLSVNHAVRNCPRRREYKKCGKCGEGTHHWTTCLNVEAEKEELDAKAPPFQPGSNDQQNDKSHNYTEMSERNDKSEDVKLKPGDYPPLVLAEIKTGDGRWTRARCLLDTGSNSSLIRTQFARRNQLCGGSPCYVSFKVAGGGVHRERAEEWEFQIRAVGGSESYFVTATGVKKPCSDVKGIPTDGFVKYEHLADVQDKIFVAGGEVDILIGQDYAPLVVPERVLRAESSPDQKPSAAVTRLGYYLYGSLSEKLISPTKQIMSINRVDKWEEEEMKLFFYGDVLGVRPTSLCVCTDNEISESAFIKHVTKIKEKDENISKIENELLNLQEECESVNHRNLNLIKEKDDEIYEKRNQIEQLCNEIKQYSENIAVAADTGLQTLKENEQLKEDIEKYREVQNENEQLREDFAMCTEHQKENEQLKEDIAVCREELINLRQTLNDADIEMVELKTCEENHSNEILEKHILIGELKAELIGLRESFKNEKEKFHKSEDACNELENKLHEKEGNVAQLSMDLKESMNITEEFKCKKEESNENWHVLMEKYEELQEKCRYLEDCNSQLEENYANLETSNGTLIQDVTSIQEEKEHIMEELNKLTYINSNVENKLQAALDKVVGMQNELDVKCKAVNSMDVLLKEKGDKGSKFKMVAIKAKKELEGQRSKFLEEKGLFEQQVDTLKEEATYLEKELVRQKTECSKHEEEFEEFEMEIKELKTNLLCNEESLKVMEESFTSRNEECEKLKELLQDSQAMLVSKDDELENLNSEREHIQKQLDSLLKEGEQMNLMNLEIVDYERTVTNLNAKLDVKEKQYIESRETIGKITEIQKAMENEIASLKKESADIDEKNQKLKAMVMKLKKDLSEKQRQEEETLAHVNELDLIIEKLKQVNEDMKLEIANLNKEKMDLSKEMRGTVEHHEKNYQTLEVKFARVSNDLLTSQRENQSLSQEFEQYKVRAHNMLKRAQGRVDVFWDTWVRHMPPQLNLRNKWFHSRENIEKGDFVIVLEKGIRGQTAPRSQWKKAVVTDVHPGTDGLVRSVTIRDPDRNEYIRPIHKLCLIATKAELEAE